VVHPRAGVTPPAGAGGGRTMTWFVRQGITFIRAGFRSRRCWLRPLTWGLAPTRLWCLPCGLRPRPSAIVGLMLISVTANIEATANSEHRYMLLREKDPGFLAVPELAVNSVDRELCGECPETARR
jgi:hypothetical protein